MTNVGSYSVDELGDYLLDSDIPPDVATVFYGKLLQFHYAAASSFQLSMLYLHFFIPVNIPIPQRTKSMETIFWS